MPKGTVPEGYRHWKNVPNNLQAIEREKYSQDPLIASPYFDDHAIEFFKHREHLMEGLVGFYLKLPPKPWLELAARIFEERGEGGWLEVQDYELAEILEKYASDIYSLVNESRNR